MKNKSTSASSFSCSPKLSLFLSFCPSTGSGEKWEIGEKCSFWEPSIEHLLFLKNTILRSKVRWRWRVGAVVHMMPAHQQPTSEWSWRFNEDSHKGLTIFPCAVPPLCCKYSFLKSPKLSYRNPFFSRILSFLCSFATLNCCRDSRRKKIKHAYTHC